MRTDEKLIGAAMERKAVLRKVRATRKATNSEYLSGFELERWLLDRDRRYNKRKGGLGK